VERLESTVRQRAIDIIDGLVERAEASEATGKRSEASEATGKRQGSCDFMADFATRFPTTIFLDLMGLPVDELDQYLEWEHDILHAGGSDEEKLQKQITAMFAVMGRFSTIIAERREDPRDDIVSKALNYEIDGKPVTDQDLLSFCLLMFMAGLDTVSVTLGWTRL
jgi:cytochrome P450